MCVAVIVESKYNIRKKDLLAMEGDNPDGAGIAWIEDGKVHFSRGLSASQVFNLQKDLPRPFFLHFRYATRGGKSQLLTHPFPLGFDAFTAGLTGSSDEGVLMHNGTWGDYRRWIPEGINSNDVSDTQVAAYALTIAKEGHTLLDDVSWATAIMFKDKGSWNINYRGTWTAHKGNRYSNLHWKTRSRRHVMPKATPYVIGPSRAHASWWNKSDTRATYAEGSFEEWQEKKRREFTSSRKGAASTGSKIYAPDSPTGSDPQQHLWDKLLELEDDEITMTLEEALDDSTAFGVDDNTAFGVGGTAFGVDDGTAFGVEDGRWLDPEQAEIEACLQAAWLAGDES